MPKRTSGRKKGIQRGVQRGRFGRKKTLDGPLDEQNYNEDPEFLCLRRSKYSSIGEKCFQSLLACCESLHVIGFKRGQNGEYVPKGGMARIRHYFISISCLALCMVRTWKTLQYFLNEELGMKSFMCLTISMVHIVAVLLGLPIVMRSKQTMDLLNSWSHISASLKQIDPSSKFHPLDNMSACLKVVAGFLVHQGVAIAVGLMSLLIADLPIFVFPLVESSGWIPEGILPKWAWQVIFATLESLLAWPFMLIASFSECCLFMENGALDVYLQRLRNMNLRSLEARKKLEQMYVQLELFNKIAQVWIRFYFPPWLFGLSNTVIVASVIAIRYTELPIIFYVFVPYTGATLMILIFWQSYDMLNVIRASEDVLGGLWRHDAPYFQWMGRAKRGELMKRSKAMRPLMFILADSEFSISLPINTWDEILNQILFILSL